MRVASYCVMKINLSAPYEEMLDQGVYGKMHVSNGRFPSKHAGAGAGTDRHLTRGNTEFFSIYNDVQLHYKMAEQPKMSNQRYARLLTQRKYCDEPR
jgi:hypothetical protein